MLKKLNNRAGHRLKLFNPMNCRSFIDYSVGLMHDSAKRRKKKSVMIFFFFFCCRRCNVHFQSGINMCSGIQSKDTNYYSASEVIAEGVFWYF